MKHSLLVAPLALLAALVSPTYAGIADTPLPAGTFHLFSVPGVINDAGLGTYFLCTSVSTDPQTVTVQVFQNTGSANGSATLIVGGGESVMFGTRNAVDIFVSPGGNTSSAAINYAGSARIVSTVNRKLLCTAAVVDAVSSPPTTSWQLTIVAKLKQKAAN